MRSLASPAVDVQHPTACAVVFLPGFGDDEHSFVDHGFIAVLREHHLAIDAYSADATYGYYGGRSLLPRLREDVLRPLRAAGYRELWIVGVSMGGLGAVLLARDQHPTIAGVYLLAPYLGSDALLREIQQAGGLARWDPGPPGADDYHEVWRYLQAVTGSPEGPPLLFFGAGDDDRHRVPGRHPLVEALPADHVYHTPGGHDWGPWSRLWGDFLEHSELRSRCAPAHG
jgi:pimeloyl-ACP methyl ester carboxylesterase